jgi:predicted deacetylase
MYDKFSKLLKNNTGILIRFDDIAPNMNWTMMERCEILLNKFDVKPILGVIPDNKDSELMNYPIKNDFWDVVKNWQSKNWSIAMHGYNHLYDSDTHKKDYFEYGGRSEFFGHSQKNQILKIKKGLKIFKNNNIEIKTFFAPNHTYDLNTFKALKDCGILQVIDGYGLSTFTINEIKFIPQLFYNLYILPYGIQSTQIHLNNWIENDFRTFEKFIEKYHKKIINLDYALSINNNTVLMKILNILIKQTLKTIRRIY